MKIKVNPWVIKYLKFDGFEEKFKVWERSCQETNRPIASIIKIKDSKTSIDSFFCSVSDCFLTEHFFSYNKNFDSIYRSVFWCDTVLASNGIILEKPFVFCID
jgi:hypothetical protein